MSKDEYIKSLIKEYGHSLLQGFYIELHTGEIFYNGTEEYKLWYQEKEEEYTNQYIDE